MGFRRHTVIDHGWDSEKQKGWMKFRCNHCGYEYRMWMYHPKLWVWKPPKRPGANRTRQRQYYNEHEINFYSSYWGPKGTGSPSEGCTVSECKGCLPKRKK